jgi:hypothetical protein
MGYRAIVRLVRRLFSLAAAASALVALSAVVTAAPDGGAASSDGGLAPARKDGGAPISKTPPDPPPMSERGQWIFDLRWDKGDIYLLGVHRIDLGTAQATPRAMGRFALELFEGPTLIERVRFDFPFLMFGDLGPDAGMEGRMRPTFDKKLTTRIGVMVPATKRGNRLELVDRMTEKRMPLPWPPTEMRADAKPGVKSDGGL